MMLLLVLASVLSFSNARLFEPRQLNPLIFENDDFIVTVTGNQNVPKYTFRNKASENEYKVFFSQFYESVDGTKLGPSNIALPSLSWAFEDVSTDEETVFWINSTDSKAPFDLLAFKNRLIDESVKFDVYLNGYQWVGADSDAVNLVWRMTNATESGESEPATVDDTQVCYFSGDGDDAEEACFEAVQTAVATGDDGSETDVAVSLSTKGNNIVVSYERFEGDLLHDPTFTVSTGNQSLWQRLVGRFRTFFGRFFGRN